MILLIYLLKVLGCSALLTAYYYLFLRNRGFHLYNRFFILFIFVLSVLLPFVRIPYIENSGISSFPVLQSMSPDMLPEVVLTFEQETSMQAILSKYILGTIYAIIVFYLLGKICRSIIYLVKLTQRFPSASLGKLKLFFTDEPATPFSFFNWIFWNNTLDAESKAGSQVLQHELYHVKEKHSLDLLFVECLMAICWFNPFFYYLRTELKAIHEFLADKAAVNGMNNNEYAELLLLHAIAEKKYQLSHPFFHNQIKRRIIMITQMKKTNFDYIRRVMCLPFMFLVCLSCSREINDANSNGRENTDVDKRDLLTESKLQVDTFKITPEDLESLLISKASTKSISANSVGELTYISFDGGPVYAVNKAELQEWDERQSQGIKPSTGPIRSKQVDYDQTFTKLEVSPAYPGGVGAWMRFLNQTFRYPDEAVEKEVQGTVVVQFTVDKEGNVGDVEAISGPELLKPEAVRVIKATRKWIPGSQNGQKVKAYHKQPITFRLQSE